MEKERELVKIKSENPDHPRGYYIQFKDQVKEGDVEFIDNQTDPDPVNTKKRTKK